MAASVTVANPRGVRAICTDVNAAPSSVKATTVQPNSESAFAMTEQPRTITLTRIVETSGYVDNKRLNEIAAWVRQWITRPVRDG